MVSFHHVLCPIVGSQVFGHGHPTSGGTAAPKCIGWVTKFCVGWNAYIFNPWEQKEAGMEMGWSSSRWMHSWKDGKWLEVVEHWQIGGYSHALPGSSLLSAEPCPIICWKLLRRSCTGLYLLSWEIFILDANQVYFCDLLNTSTLFLKQSWKHFIPDLFAASFQTCSAHWGRSQDASHRTSQVNIKSLLFSLWKWVFWEYYVVTAANFSHSRWQTCPVWRVQWKRPVAL